ncbi:MAG TPA: hypothetical protein VFZ66_15555 [Herpetosiphonaceae bacterium]
MPEGPDTARAPDTLYSDPVAQEEPSMRACTILAESNFRAVTEHEPVRAVAADACSGEHETAHLGMPRRWLGCVMVLTRRRSTVPPSTKP